MADTTIKDLKDKQKQRLSQWRSLQTHQEREQFVSDMLTALFKLEKQILEAADAPIESDKAHWLDCRECEGENRVDPRYSDNPICKECREIDNEAHAETIAFLKPALKQAAKRRHLKSPRMQRLAREASLMHEGKTSTEISKIIAAEFDISERTVWRDLADAEVHETVSLN